MLDVIVILVVLGMAYLGFSWGMLTVLGGFVGLKLGFALSRSPYLQTLLAARLGFGSETTIAFVIFVIVLLTGFALSKVMTTRLDIKGGILWLPNRVLGAVLGLALGIAIVSQAWAYLGKGDAESGAVESKVLEWVIFQDYRFGLSERVIGLGRSQIEKAKELVDGEKESQ
ncbi:MAG TPA: CvpA family protein [Proteobacteria bacterium]|nr:CvpA family protein [Pseudomonadota bacterium]